MKADSAILRPLDNFLEEITDEYVKYEFTLGELPQMDWELLFKMFKTVDLCNELIEHYGCFGETHYRHSGVQTLTLWFKDE